MAKKQIQTDEAIANTLAEALRRVFGENESAKRFVDVSRIPLICKSILDIHSSIEEIKDMIKISNTDHVNQFQFAPVKAIVYGMVGMILTGFVAALILLIFPH